ncbi:hypothetical protein T484DRAFT_1772128 [Baffinella frigidus]|nr:hypothetical protein T484DRAFT_1772128 [Cryptophyta sp. CCMP2293]
MDARLKEIADLLQSSKSALDGQIVTLKDRISDLEESRRQMLARLEAASWGETISGEAARFKGQEEAARLKAQVAKMEKQIDACATPSLCAPGQVLRA